MGVLEDFLCKSAYKVGSLLGQGKKIVKKGQRIYEALPEMIQEGLLFLGFSIYTTYLLRQSTIDKKLPSARRIRQKFLNIIPSEIIDNYISWSIELDKQINPKEIKKVGELLSKRLNLANRKELIKILIYFICEDNMIDQSLLKELNSIRKDLCIGEGTFDDLTRQFMGSAAIINADYFYTILGVDKKASPKEIHKAYLKMATKYHPDRYFNKSSGEQDEAHNNFIKINQAYQNIRKD